MFWGIKKQNALRGKYGYLNRGVLRDAVGQLWVVRVQNVVEVAIHIGNLFY